jgi:O-antigen/teichoic acid export membrane protein
VGVVVAAVLAKERPRPADPRNWLRDTRYLSGWMTLTSVLGQAEIYAVIVIAGVVLLPEEAAGLRAVQLLVFQPAVTLLTAMLVILTPVAARAVVAGDTDAVRAVRRSALIWSGCVGVIVLLIVPFRGPLLAVLFPQYAGFENLVPPIAFQTAVLALTVPFHALLRGYRRARTESLLQTVNAVCLVGAATVGMVLGAVHGLAWAMAVVSLGTLAGYAWLGPRPGQDTTRRRPGSTDPASTTPRGIEAG